MSEQACHLVVLLCSDLMLTSNTGAAARAAGYDFVSTPDPNEAAQLASSDRSVRLLVDFATPGLAISEFAQQLPEPVRQSAVAYGPHVHTAMFEAARNAGIGRVISRGQFSASLSTLIHPADRQTFTARHLAHLPAENAAFRHERGPNPVPGDGP